MTKSRAQTLLDEQLDEVKNMNQMMLYSKCVTIRDAQLEEKKHVKAEAAEEERRLDVMMEVERLKALDLYEALARSREPRTDAGAPRFSRSRSRSGRRSESSRMSSSTWTGS